MNRVAARRQLRRDGWLQLLPILLPVVVLDVLFASGAPLATARALPLFMLGLATLFFSLPRFTAFKHALIATERALGSPAETAAWAALRRTRRKALWMAALPAWVAALGVPLGLEPAAQWLLVLASLVLLALYRIPRQLH